MAASLIALIPALLALQAQPERVIVATVEKPPEALVKELRAMPLPKALDRLQKDGFVKVTQGERTYVIDPFLMQEKLSKNLPGFYESLSKLSQGTFSPKDNAQLTRFAEAAFGDRFDQFGESALALSGAATVQLVADGRSITVRRESDLGSKGRAALESAPLIRRDPDKARTDPASLSEFTPSICESVHLLILGKPEYRQFLWAKDIEAVGKVVNTRLQELQGAAVAAVHGLFSKLPSGDIASQASSLEKGQSFATMPNELKTSLQAEITGQYQRFGFADQDEAERFLARAQIGDVKKGFKVTGAKGKASFVSVILYP